MKFSDIVFVRYYRPYERHILAGLVGLICLSIGCYVLWNFAPRAPKVKDPQDVPNASNTLLTADIYFFNVDWCPHCTKAKPEWVNFFTKYDGKVVGNYTVNCIGGEDGTDCTDTSDPKVNDAIARFDLEHYPTVKMVKDNEVYDFDARVSSSSLGQFIQATLGQ
jgi:thiol-disulfide isomerase/thioredoxin